MVSAWFPFYDLLSRTQLGYEIVKLFYISSFLRSQIDRTLSFHKTTC